VRRVPNSPTISKSFCIQRLGVRRCRQSLPRHLTAASRCSLPRSLGDMGVQVTWECHQVGVSIASETQATRETRSHGSTPKLGSIYYMDMSQEADTPIYRVTWETWSGGESQPLGKFQPLVSLGFQITWERSHLGVPICWHSWANWTRYTRRPTSCSCPRHYQAPRVATSTSSRAISSGYTRRRRPRPRAEGRP